MQPSLITPVYDCLIHNALVLTLEPGAEPLFPGFVAVSGDKIAGVGQLPPGQRLPPAREYLDPAGTLVMPGLINTHTHAPMVWFRGLADDLALDAWLNKFIFPAEARWLNPERAYWGTLLAACEMIRGGITTVADGYFFEAEVRRAFHQAGLRAVAAQGVVRQFRCAATTRFTTYHHLAEIPLKKKLESPAALIHAVAMNLFTSSAPRYVDVQHRRGFLSQLALGTILFAVPGAFAEALPQTPRQTEGPFYPDHLPLDTDNDLIVINDGLTPAVGEVTWLSGRVLDARGEPIRNALVEIWQCDAKGVYLHTGDSDAK